MKIAVMRNAGSTQANLVLGGVYGELIRNQDGTAEFKFASEFNPVSSVFQNIPTGKVPVIESDVQEYDVADGLAAAVKANLMHALGMKWDGLYSNPVVAGRARSMVGSMMNAESNRTLNGARNFVSSQGMNAYKVNFEIEAESADRSSDIATADQLLHAMKPLEGAAPNFTSVEQLDPSVIGAKKQEIQNVNSEGDDQPIDQVRPWSFEGRKAAGLLVASVTVMAPTAEAAKSVAALVLGVEPVQQQAEAQAALPAPAEAQTMTEAILQAPAAGLARFFGRARQAPVPQEQAPAEVPAVVAEVTADDNTRSVNSFRENPIFGTLTTTPSAVQNLRAGSEIVYNNYEQDEDEDETYGDRPRY